MYRILGNFSVIKGSHEKISLSKSFALWAFHENITHGENMEEYGRDWRIRSYTMMAGLVQTVGLYCPCGSWDV